MGSQTHSVANEGGESRISARLADFSQAVVLEQLADARIAAVLNGREQRARLLVEREFVGNLLLGLGEES